MGATTIHHEVPKDRYESPSAAYRALVEDALYEYGHDPYSGTIATCEFQGRCKTPNDNEEYDLILDKMRKREVCYYDKGDYWVFIGWAAC